MRLCFFMYFMFIIRGALFIKKNIKWQIFIDF